ATGTSLFVSMARVASSISKRSVRVQSRSVVASSQRRARRQPRTSLIGAGVEGCRALVMRAWGSGRQVKLVPPDASRDFRTMVWTPPVCPYLPPADLALNAGCLTAHGPARD